MKRRSVLVGGSALGSGLLAGCTTSRNSDEPPSEEIVRFSVTNEDDVARSIAVEIQVDGEVVAAGQGTLPPANEQELPFRYGFPSIGTPVTAVVQSDNASRSVQWDPADCAELQVDAKIVEGEPELEETCQ